MKIKYFRYLLGLGITLSLVSCGSSEGNLKESKSTIITDENYISLAKYSFLKENQRVSRAKDIDLKNNNKFRSIPGSSTIGITNDKALKISSVTPFDKYVQSMIITNQNSKIQIEIKDDLYAIISLYKDGELVKSTKQSMKKFSSFDKKGFGEEL